MAKVVAEETESSDEKRRLVAAILQLGGTPGFETVAKGIDSESQRNRLRASGSVMASGTPTRIQSRHTSSTLRSNARTSHSPLV